MEIGFLAQKSFDKLQNTLYDEYICVYVNA